MLTDRWWRDQMTEEDFEFYERLLPAEHPLLDALELIPWDSFVPMIEQYYSADRGQPAILPLLMLKLEFLRYFCRLSDREVIARCSTDVLYRYFLQVPVHVRMPAPTSLVNFRGRLGVDGFQKVFDQLIAGARVAGMVRDRLRLKDASHMLAKIAVPSTLKLLGQLRGKMLVQIAKLDPVAASGFEVTINGMQKDTLAAGDAIRLEQRVELLQEMLQWLNEQLPSLAVEQSDVEQEVRRVIELASKILADTIAPGRGDRTLSVVDPEARRSRHGEWYEGYCVDVMMDADSRLITAVDVIVAGGDEAVSAVNLAKKEQETHVNQIEAISIDGVGFNGPMLRTFEGPDGLGVKVFTPTRESTNVNVIGVDQFEYTEDGRQVICPAGKQSSTRQRDDARHRTCFLFSRSTCEGCPLLSQCKPVLGDGHYGGRMVTKNDYEEEHQRARARTKTDEYAAVRREHPAIERKLNQVMNHQGARQAKYWGLAKNKIQALMTCFTVDVKEMLRLFEEETALTTN